MYRSPHVNLNYHFVTIACCCIVSSIQLRPFCQNLFCWCCCNVTSDLSSVWKCFIYLKALGDDKISKLPLKYNIGNTLHFWNARGEIKAFWQSPDAKLLIITLVYILSLLVSDYDLLILWFIIHTDWLTAFCHKCSVGDC